MTAINTQKELSFNEIVTLIAATGHDVSWVIEGEPGTAKTSLRFPLLDFMGEEYEGIYIDAPAIERGDIFMRIPDRETKQLEQYMTGLIGDVVRRSKIPIILIDEIWKVTTKADRALYTRLLLERDCGDIKLHPRCIVMGTSNNVSDGVGDLPEAHAGNRVGRVVMRKQTNKEYCAWAGNNGVSAVTRGWAMATPRAFQSYRHLSPEELNQNEFIFNPGKPQNQYLSLRSLTKADCVLRRVDVLGEDVTEIAMAGIVGAPAAASIMAQYRIGNKLPKVADIIASPETTPVPEGAGASLQLMFNMVDEVATAGDLTQVWRYVLRFPRREFIGVFVSSLFGSKRTHRLAKSNKEVNDWYMTDSNRELVS